ncbi:MAG: FAD-dependent oxidoreductase [Bacteroidales bacterium]
MIKLKIDNIEIFVPEGTTLLKAAEKTGIHIPTMCYNENVSNHASCMICAVKNNISGEFLPSCEVKVQQDMDISCSSQEVAEFRKDALELLLSDHVGNCEAPCRISCPAFMNIPLMNRLIAQGDFEKALEVVKEEIALPLILGFICSAPCENACRRKQMEAAVSICQLKKFVALEDSNKEKYYLPEKSPEKNKKTAVIGSGMAGLSAAFHLLKLGYSCTVFEKNDSAGGSLLQLSEEVLPKVILNTEIEILKQFGLELKLNSKIEYEQIKSDFDAIIIATGENSNSSAIMFYEDSFTSNHPKIFACGSVIRPVKMAVKVVAQGKTAAYNVHSFLSVNLLKHQEKQFNSRFAKLDEKEVVEYMKESASGERNFAKNGNLSGFSEEEAITEAKRCLRCDCRKSQTCKLRIYATEYKADQFKYKYGERKSIKKYFQQDVLVYEPEKCIKCGNCIEIVSKNKDLTGLAYIGRGFEMHISVPFSKTLKQGIASAAQDCINVCPTAALSAFSGEDKYKTIRQ